MKTCIKTRQSSATITGKSKKSCQNTTNRVSGLTTFVVAQHYNDGFVRVQQFLTYHTEYETNSGKYGGRTNSITPGEASIAALTTCEMGIVN